MTGRIKWRNLMVNSQLVFVVNAQESWFKTVVICDRGIAFPWKSRGTDRWFWVSKTGESVGPCVAALHRFFMRIMREFWVSKSAKWLPVCVRITMVLRFVPMMNTIATNEKNVLNCSWKDLLIASDSTRQLLLSRSLWATSCETTEFEHK